MNELEQLDEEIKQLSERVEQLTNFVESTKAILEAAEKERDRLAAQCKEQPKFERVKEDTPYFSLSFDVRAGLILISSTEKGICFDSAAYNNNNYFHTKDDWNDGKNKYFVFYDNTSKRYAFNAVAVVEYEPGVYFPTGKIAKKVCDILNAEQEETA